ncbi:MAG: NAD(P)-dependent oxidoreductase, partial [Acidobacteria bacterium]|nr:NAD(P)-dependent oxidoreductase [Acidobacteriota bacterium]
NRDILTPADLPMIGDYDVVVHLAALLDKREAAAPEVFRTNAEGTANVLRYVREGAAFIYASTKDVYGANAEGLAEVGEDCPVTYAGHTALEWSKLIGERYVDYYAARRNFRACVFRLSTVYARPSEGNEPGFVTHCVESVKRGHTLRLPAAGAPVRDLLHVEDFSRACRAFADSHVARGVYNLGGGRANAVPLREIAETVGRLIERQPVYDEGPPPPAPVPFDYVSDLSRVRAELGWEPSIGVEEGLKSLL